VTPAAPDPPPAIATRGLDMLAAGAQSILGRPLGSPELELFGKYLWLLQKWQRVQRLVGSSDPEWIVENLFLDSLLFLRVIPRDLVAMADVGSGAGFPGLPLKIVRPDLDVTLIESRQRRASFLAATTRELGLVGVRVVSARVEIAPEELLGAFGAVVMRCAGGVKELLPSVAKLVSPGGMIVCSGPPARRPLEGGEWVEIQGFRPGRTRLFAVFRA
jgi:16S rRNA (guanine527-N7)-methyltransferase